jgi:undecaprenyl-diphosphatase
VGVFEAAVLGIVQGLTEFLPVSSSGHLILARWAFGWDAGALGLPFDLACHLGTLAAVVWFFRADLLAMVRAVPSAFSSHPSPDGRRIWLIAAATVPVVIAGLTLESWFETFRDPHYIAYTLVIGAGLLFLVERLSPRTGTEATLTMTGAVLIGVAQVCALFPGVSRSGATITAGMLLGLNRLAAARFAFLMSVPAIGGAGLKKLLDMRDVTLGPGDPQMFLVGFLSSALIGYVTVNFLLKYLVSHKLDIFAWYRLVIAAALFYWL